MDYSKLSDFEINKLVARALDGISPSDKITAIDCYLSKQDSSCVKWYKHDYFDLSEFDLFDPCNNPSDAWPIITENKIAIKPKLIAKKEYATPSDYIDEIDEAAERRLLALNEFGYHKNHGRKQ